MQMNPAEAVLLLGIDPLKYINRAKSFEEACKKLEEFKEELKIVYRRKCKELHPDINPNADLEQIQKLNVAKEMMMKLKLMRPRPRPVVTFVRVDMRHSYHDFTRASGTTATSGTWYNTY